MKEQDKTDSVNLILLLFFMGKIILTFIVILL